VRKLVLSLLSFLTFTLATLASAQTKAPAPATTATAKPATATTEPVAELSIGDAIILGVVEGVTEFLPVSSTGHLIIATHVLNLESEKPLISKDGQPLWYRKPSPKHPEGIPLTMKLAADTYTVVIQFGAIAAVTFLYWSQLMSMLRGLLGRDPAGLKLLISVLIAFAPAAVIGLLAHEWINDNLFSIPTVIVAQVVGAGLMIYAEAWRRRHVAAVVTSTKDDFANLTPKAAVGIGALQCFAMWPGMSRSMTTIVGGYFAGLDPRRSAEFSFILGFVTLTGATVLKSYKSGAAMIQVFGWSHVLLGAVVAAITAAICVRFLVHWLTRHGLTAFAYYRIAFAAVLAVVFYL
jgi:undecaprenyl-diphosphatase